ncbi:hypothetical protein SBA6_160007 [Candidatus Sulfopaludibacter sp. SbA6]|nr:hypothetical protein SBA6_160007 [Candidatus Sulfopaludibacter sp. SbA6]
MAVASGRWHGSRPLRLPELRADRDHPGQRSAVTLVYQSLYMWQGAPAEVGQAGYPLGPPANLRRHHRTRSGCPFWGVAP